MSTNKQALLKKLNRRLNDAFGFQRTSGGKHTTISLSISECKSVIVALGELDKWQQESSTWQSVAEKQLAIAIEAEKRIAELEARPANPINFKENADADFCRKLAWDEVKKELAPEAWSVGDNFNYYGFFCWGWDSRRQFNEQRAAGITVKGE